MLRDQKKKDEVVCNGGSTCAVAIFFPAAQYVLRTVCLSFGEGAMADVGTVWQPDAAKKKSDAKPEAHSAAHDGVIDSTDDGRGTLRNTATF